MDAKTMKEFMEITEKTHTEQGIWFLNGFWDGEPGGEELGEEIWKFVQQFRELENDGPIIRYKGKKAKEQKQYVEGSDLDPHKSHRFLETLGETLTVVALRKKLAEIDLDNNKRMAIAEYLLFKYNKTPKELVNSPQGEDTAAIDAAQAKMKQVQEALGEVMGKLDEVKANTEEVKAKLTDVKTKLAEQKDQKEKNDDALAKLKAAKDELAAALAELKKEEDAFAKKKSELEARSSDDSLGVVQRNKAKNQLAQMEAEDPMPLRKAKITQGAALKRTEKAEKAAKKTEASLKAAIEESEKAQAELEEAEKNLAQAKTELEQAQDALSAQMEEAEAELAKAKAKGGVAHGAVWWMEKELKEARKYGGGKRK